jgi:hypothetical protein
VTRTEAPRDGDRGQTLPDFAVGIAVFLLTIAFVSVFVPQLMVPFDGQERPVVADRFASELSGDVLTESGSGSELNESDTRAFFAQNSTETLAQFGAASWYSLNVTLRDAPSRDADSAVLCAGSDDEWWITDCGDDAERFAVGESVPRDERSVATAQRALFAVETAENRTEYVVLEVSIW